MAQSLRVAGGVRFHPSRMPILQAAKSRWRGEEGGWTGLLPKTAAGQRGMHIAPGSLLRWMAGGGQKVRLPL